MYRTTKRAMSPMAKGQLNAAFKTLRQMGYLARQHYKCCSSCGGYALAEDASARVDAGKVPPRGVVFYHAQDAEDLATQAGCYLRYGPAETEKHGTLGLETEQVGAEVVTVMRRHGLAVKWDGNGGTCIWVEEPVAPVVPEVPGFDAPAIL